MEPITATTLATTVAAKGFQGLLTSLLDRYVFKRTAALGPNRDQIKTDLTDHLNVVFEKCMLTKTILNDSPVNLLSIYVDQRFKRGHEVIDQYSLVEAIRESGISFIITGIGGGGKSFFMKYLWLSFFENSGGKLPLFIEVRQINSSTTVNIKDFLFHSVIRTGSTISQVNFDTAIRQGEVVLFLDGFDEIVPEKRRDAEMQIQQLRENNPKLVVVMTSRPDDRFGGWHQFEHVDVLPMSKEEAELLIDRAIYDDLSKSRLLKRIREGLYDSHQSFLSNPLLAYMMLLTIARNPDIPNKMSAFYELAFDALYHRHDTVKGGGFIRKYYTELDKQQFIRLLSYFCLSTYVDGIVEASEERIISYIDMSKEFEGVTEKSASFLRDMVDNVCLMKKDGIHYNFIHRSFQEYFAAVCICRVANRDIEELFGHFAERYNDEVLPMVAEMDPDLFREKYLIPMRERFSAYFDLSAEDATPEMYMKYTGQTFVGRWRGEVKKAKRGSKGAGRRIDREAETVLVMLEGGSDFNRFVSSLHSVAGFGRIERELDEKVDRQRRLDIDERFFVAASERFNLKTEDGIRLSSDGNEMFLHTKEGAVVRDPWIARTFAETYMHRFVRFHAERSHLFVNSEVSQYSRVSDTFQQMIKRARSRTKNPA